MTTRGFDAGALVPESLCNGLRVRLFVKVMKENFLQTRVYLVGLRLYDIDYRFCSHVFPRLIGSPTSIRTNDKFLHRFADVLFYKTSSLDKVNCREGRQVDAFIAWPVPVIDGQQRKDPFDKGEIYSRLIAESVIGDPAQVSPFGSEESYSDNWGNTYTRDHIKLKNGLDVEVHKYGQIIDAERINCHGVTFLGGEFWLENPAPIIDRLGFSNITQSEVRSGDIVLYLKDETWTHSGIIVEVKPNLEDTMIFHDPGIASPMVMTLGEIEIIVRTEDDQPSGFGQPYFFRPPNVMR